MFFKLIITTYLKILKYVLKQHRCTGINLKTFHHKNILKLLRLYKQSLNVKNNLITNKFHL